MRSTSETGDSHRSVVEGLGSTARVITSAALIMISVFGAFIWTDDVMVKMFGLGLAVAVLVDATLVRMVLVPATMALLGNANWWLPKWLDRILPHLDLEGGPTPATAELPGPAGARSRSPPESVTSRRSPPRTNRFGSSAAVSRLGQNRDCVTAVLATKLFEPRVPQGSGLAAAARRSASTTGSRRGSRWCRHLPATASPASSASGGRHRKGAATRLAWLSVDEADSDPVRFWTHVAAALHHVDPDVGVELSESLQRQGPVTAPAEAGRAASTSWPRWASRWCWCSTTSTRCPAATSSNRCPSSSPTCPPQVRLVIASRTDPPLPLAAMRARGELSELRMPDLRFTRDELDAYFDGLGIVLDIDSLRMLGSRTEGWAAGLHLAALTLADVDDRAAFVRRFAGDDRTVVDYLADEVLARQPPDVQDFLLATSILERMTGPLCDAVTEPRRGQAMLHALEQANLFLVALDNTARGSAITTCSPSCSATSCAPGGTVAEHDLRERAARWLADQGLVEEAVPHAVTAEAWDLAIDLGTVHGLTMVVQGLSTTFRQLYGAPPEELRKRPEAALGLRLDGRCSSGDLDSARRWLKASDVAIARRSTCHPDRGSTPRSCTPCSPNDTARSSASLAAAERVLALLDDHPEVVGIDRDARHGRALLFQARAALLGDQLDVAHDVLTDALAVLASTSRRAPWSRPPACAA